MNNNLLPFDSFSLKNISIDLFESKFPCLFSNIDNDWYLNVKIDGKTYFAWVVLNWIFKSRPFFNIEHLEIIEKAYRRSEVTIPKAEINYEILSILDDIYINLNLWDTKKDL